MSQFYPRPEAQATTWYELMTPVQIAVRDLLIRIQGAHDSVLSKDTDKPSNSSTQQTGNCFLVYGLRGTGKTTVLLNAQKAVCPKSGESFFQEPQNQTPSEKEAREAAKKQTDSLRKGGVIWLDILDLQPLPSEANLLTVLLTQVRKALHSRCDKGHRERRSIFEEEANNAQQQLTRLIDDATLMWQNIVEPDTRNIANCQVKAADIYANFQEKFKKAMDKLVEELRDVCSSDAKISIVLPIDNIDRSTEHLQAIVKLAQLVSHPSLWFVMAGDRFEVDTFLERAYWKELIRGSDSSGARGKMDSEGEDEALVMARRQANAAAQKLWPANHRIEVNLVSPEDTLGFKYEQNSASGEATNTIRELLKKIQIPTTADQRKTADQCDPKQISLFKLFDVTAEVGKPYLTRVAHHGLLLSARSVLDLWQLLDWLIEDGGISSNGKNFKAEKVTRTILRNAIASSNMPSWIAQKLQNDILRRGEKGGTILYFKKDESLKLSYMTFVNHNFEYALSSVVSSDHKLRSHLNVKDIGDVTLRLQHNYLPTELCDSLDGSVKNQYPQPFVIEQVNKKGLIELPPLVAAWLMALYDILILAEDDASSWVIDPSSDIKWFHVSVHHIFIISSKEIDVELHWNAPYWKLFWGRNILRLRWQEFREIVAKQFPNDQMSQARTLIPRILAVGWIFCVLSTSIKLIYSIDPEFNLQMKNIIPEFEQVKNIISTIKDKKCIQNFEKQIILAADGFYSLIKEYKFTEETNSAAYVLMIATSNWLEEELIYFLSYVYVPIKPEDSKTRLETLWESLKDNSDLKTHWKENGLFILAALDKKLEDVRNSDPNNTGKAQDYDKYIESLSVLADLHILLK